MRINTPETPEPTQPDPQQLEQGGDPDAGADSIENGGEKRGDGHLKYSVPALEKGLRILELLSHEPLGLTQTDVAEKMGKSLGEVFRMVVCMRDLGYVAFVPNTDRYVLTPKLFELSHRHPPMKRLITEAVPRMQALAHELHQSCHLTVYNDGGQVVVAQVDNPGGMGFSVRMGTQMDLVLTASGRALLAFQTGPNVARMLGEYRGKADKTQIMNVRKLLPGIREQGYAEMPSAQVKGVHGLAFPVCDHLGLPLAAIVVPYLEQMVDAKHTTFDEAREALCLVASELATAIGGSHDDPAENMHTERPEGPAIAKRRTDTR